MNRIEPQFQRRSRILKNCAAHRIFVVSAILTSIGRPISLAMMLCDFLARRATDPIWVESLDQYFEAGCIVWILALELHQRIQPFARASFEWIVSIDFAHTANHGISVYFRQGDTYPSFRQKLFFCGKRASPDFGRRAA